MPLLYHHRAANSQHTVATGIVGNASVVSICSWHKYYLRRSLLPHQFLMMKPVTVFETLEFITRLAAQKNIITVSIYVNRIRLPQSTRVLWRELGYSVLSNLTHADSHGHLSSRSQSSFILGFLSCFTMTWS
jgi:hypothetical protein